MFRDLAVLLFIIGGAAMVALSQQTLTRSDLTGAWQNGGMSTIGERNTTTGSTTPSNGHTFKYVFSENGQFTFTGLMNSTQYGCTLGLFNDKQGRYEIEGDTLTLTPTKNFWRNTNSCSAAAAKDRNYKLDAENFQIRTKTDEYGKDFICLTNDKGETCYRREK